MKNHIRQLPAWIINKYFLYLFVFLLLQIACLAQVNTGSDGHDGALNPIANTVLNMASHLDGVYQYTSVNIPANVTVTFTPNANNTTVTWLVQGNCNISGVVDVSGKSGSGNQAGLGGPGGWRGGNGGPQATGGLGPGGGTGSDRYGNYNYANVFLVPLLGGSGGAGISNGGGGGGSGSILIAVGNTLTLNGYVTANGGGGIGGNGSGGGIRLVASRIAGTGSVGGARVRFDTYDSAYSGYVPSAFSQGFQPVIIPAQGQGAQLSIVSVTGTPVATPPTGLPSTPDVVISGQQANPISVVVSCANLALNTPITVSVKPLNGSAVSVVGYNSTGTQASSTATVSLNMPRGGGLIYATAGH